jgi:23S rRNA (adenine2503-C2)-methyltransferase
MHVGKMNLLAMTYEQLKDDLHRRYGRGAYHAAALYRAFYQDPDMELAALPAFAASSELRHQVQRDLNLAMPAIVERHHQEGVTKLIFEMADGCRVEAVLVPMAHHVTVCISSQVGCRMGCRFCETGQMGWRRNLSAAEMVAQVHAVKVGMGIDVRNVVLMGMGEPLDNFDQVIQAIRVLEDQRGLNITKRRITLSTAGLVAGIEKLAALAWPQLRLAVSLNAPNDALRTALMPINRKNPLARLKSALGKYPLARGNALFVEYVLIKGVNDQPCHAEQLAGFFNGLKIKLNLIPYNPRRRSPFDAPDPAGIDRFLSALIKQKVFVRLRRSKGAAMRAACGQLGGALVSLDPETLG